jgi:hypothetical protein
MEGKKAMVKVNLTLEENVWEKFSKLVPNRKKSSVINELLRDEVDKIEREREKKEWAQAFKEAAKDKERLTAIREWDIFDSESWE